jgi:subtilase family serine protease
MSKARSSAPAVLFLRGIGSTAGRRRLAAGLVLVLAAAGTARAAPRMVLTAKVPAPVARHQVRLDGAPDPGRVLHLAVALPMRNLAGLDALLRRIYDPASPSFRHYLSVAEFTRLFGPAQSDYAAAVQFLAESGLHITGVSANRTIIDVTGSVADIERVFHLRLGLYRHPTEDRDFMAPDREPSLDLAVPVLDVIGLDDFVLPTPRLRQATTLPKRVGTGSGPHGNFIGSDIRAAYYGGSALTGAGQSVGLMELAPYSAADVKNYFARFNQPLAVTIKGISTDGSRPTCKHVCHDGEQALDIEYAISMAPGLDKVEVYVGHSPESVLNRMASDDTSAQLSTSWGWARDFATDDALFKEMAAQGQTMLTASGDYSNLKDSGPWPEEDANLTAVGGTDLTTSGPGGAWRGETGWEYSAGGPSLDRKIAIEPYQVPFITVETAGSLKVRDVPDIAGDANFNNYICFNGKCNGGWGGTSFASPIWAGFIALANERAASHGDPPVGFLNPTLYALAGRARYRRILHDETIGQSGLYFSLPAYDMVTGLGSPNGQALIDALAP